jgi:8-amino-7-oxononanoate synthase
VVNLSKKVQKHKFFGSFFIIFSSVTDMSMSSNHLLDKLQSQLQKRAEAGNLRHLKARTNLVDFCSNDYLGLAQNEDLYNIIHQKLSSLAQPYLGATGSRLISGTHTYSLELESYLANLFDAESCLIFNSGYQLNTAILSTVPQKGDTILCDELIHASLREGARLSLANRFYFLHNHLEDLEKKLQKATGDVFVVIETVYSMDGDIAPIEEIVKLCKKYDAYLIVDEAHSTGIYGKKGEGYLMEKQLHKDIFARIYTFGKGIGGHGACIVGSKILTHYLVNFARAFIYTTALPLHSLVQIYEAFEYIAQHPEIRQCLHQNIAFFRKSLGDFSENNVVLKESNTPIQILRVGGNDRTKTFATRLQEAGFDVRPVLSPTVKAGEEILRICLHTFNQETQMQHLADCIRQVVPKLPPIEGL